METSTNTISKLTNEAPVFQTPSISSSAMLVELNISTWTGRKFDKTVSQEVDTAKNTTTRGGNYSKRLFADAPIFDAISKFAGNARTYHYHTTMPWSDSGLRLLTTKMYFDYHKAITGMEMEFETLVDKFIDSYDDLVLEAQTKLGDLFNHTDYPHKEDIKDKFRFSVKYAPVPEAGDFRIDINNDAMQELQANYQNYYANNLQEAMRDVWDRTHEVLSNMSAKLSGNKKQIFRDTLVTNVTEMCDLLEKFNVTDDPKLKQAKLRIENTLRGITPDALREDDGLRLETKSKVDALLKEMSWN